jgi:sugar O-acyltransferase (sialic acid O-acetyltransferase NeuD family)
LLNLMAMTEPSKPVILLGAGGHASVLIDTLQQSGQDIMGITDPDKTLWGQEFMGVDILGDDDKILEIHPDRVSLVNALGGVRNTKARRNLFELWKNRGHSFAWVIHPKAILAPGLTRAEGVQILAGAIVNPNTVVGVNTIVNTGATLEHDCVVGDHVHIAPGATIAGNVSIGSGTHVGLGSTIIQGITVGDNCLIAAGAVVIQSVPAGSTVMGVPGKIIASKAG